MNSHWQMKGDINFKEFRDRFAALATVDPDPSEWLYLPGVNRLQVLDERGVLMKDVKEAYGLVSEEMEYIFWIFWI